MDIQYRSRDGPAAVGAASVGTPVAAPSVVEPSSTSSSAAPFPPQGERHDNVGSDDYEVVVRDPIGDSDSEENAPDWAGDATREETEEPDWGTTSRSRVKASMPLGIPANYRTSSRHDTVTAAGELGRK